jgi:hypothetical protein
LFAHTGYSPPAERLEGDAVQSREIFDPDTPKHCAQMEEMTPDVC